MYDPQDSSVNGPSVTDTCCVPLLHALTCCALFDSVRLGVTNSVLRNNPVVMSAQLCVSLRALTLPDLLVRPGRLMGVAEELTMRPPVSSTSASKVPGPPPAEESHRQHKLQRETVLQRAPCLAQMTAKCAAFCPPALTSA